jgi:adenosylhomocysteine nucleosidase
MCAFGSELRLLRSHARINTTHVINGRAYQLGQLAGKDVILVLSSTSMVNAAITAQAVIDRFPVSGIVYSGIGGGVNPGLHIGDVAVPAQWGQYQEHIFPRETAEGWDIAGFSDQFGNFGMMFPQDVAVPRQNSLLEERLFWFPGSSEMLTLARLMADDVPLARCTTGGKCLDRQPRVVVGGNGVSGPTFVDNASYRQWVWQTFQADVADMETAAVAHAAYVNRVPFIAFRALSDLAGGGMGRNEIATFYQLAADNAAMTTEAFVQRWPQ